MSFTTEYRNHIRANQRAEKSNLGSEQAHLAAAHNEAFISVVEYVLEHVIEQNEVLQLSSLRLFYLSKMVFQTLAHELAQET